MIYYDENVTKLHQMNSEVYQRRVCHIVWLCYKYITLYRELQRCCVENTHTIGASWVWSCEAIGRNLIIIQVLLLDPHVIMTA